MDRDRWRRVSELLDGALEREPAERERFVTDAASEDPSLVAEVLDLLERMESDTATPIDHPVWERPLPEGAGDDPPRHPGPVAPGDRLGPYRIVDRLGAGGSSVVFRATRDDGQFRSDVAIKVLVAAGPVRSLLRARFRTERRILATLDHPHIGRILDGGTTEAGDPYLVMELVEGEPITAYARRHRLSLADRVALFIAVCEAVHHAHQRLVVHRDLKPSNVLVRDDGVVKLLDFGIAKLLDPGRAGIDEGAAPTRTGLWLLTPAYAAPEQVQGTGITTATDVFALGVLLAELLGGSPPRTIDGRPPAEVMRMVESGEVPRPSDLARGRIEAGVSPEALRGDLDAIAARATHPDPPGRYVGALALADDLRRHGRGDAVEARGTARGYRARRWLRRHRVSVGVVVTVLLIGTTALGLHTREVTRERNRALAEARKARATAGFLADVFSVADPDEAQGETVTARELLDRAAVRLDEGLADDPATRLDLAVQLVRIHRKLGLPGDGIALGERSLAAAIRDGTPVYGQTVLAVAIADLRLDRNELEAADSLLTWAEPVIRRETGERSLDVASVRERIARLARLRGDEAVVDSLLREVLATREAQLGPDDPLVATAHHSLGVLLDDGGRTEEAERHLREAVRIRRIALPRPNSSTAASMRALGECLVHLGRVADAERLITDALAEQEALLGPDHRQVARTLYARGVVLGKLERHREAIAAYERARAIEVRSAPAHAFRVLAIDNNVAICLRALGRPAEAAARFEAVVDTCLEVYGPDHVATGIYQGNLASVLLDLGHPTDALSMARASVAVMHAHYGEEGGRVAAKLLVLARVLQAAGALDEADSTYAAAHRAYVVGAGEEYPAAATVRLDRARLRLDQGRREDAVALLDTCIAELEARRDTTDLLRARVWHAYAVATDPASGSGADRSALDAARDALRARLPATHRYVAEAEGL